MCPVAVLDQQVNTHRTLHKHHLLIITHTMDVFCQGVTKLMDFGLARELESRHLVKKGDLVILTKGEHMGIDGGTNAMKILTVGNVP